MGNNITHSHVALSIFFTRFIILYRQTDGFRTVWPRLQHQIIGRPKREVNNEIQSSPQIEILFWEKITIITNNNTQSR